MKRIISFDYIRAISVVAIVLCHCCFGMNGFAFLGGFLGGTFNVIFLTLSAFLLGLSYENKGYPMYNFSFIKHRIEKLVYSYYPFVIIMFAFLIYQGDSVTIKDWIMHFLFLPWFDKMPGFGHLWFITMIVMCYFAVFFMSRMPKSYVKLCKQGGVIVLFTIVSQILLGKVGLPNYIFIYMALYVFVFLNAKNILEFVCRLLKVPLIIVGTITIISVICCFYFNIINKYSSVWLGIISAIFIFSILHKLFLNAESNKIVEFISAISFEIYLVHHVFCFGKYSLYQIIPNPIIGTIAIITVSIILGYILNKLSKKCEFLIKKENKIKHT